MSRIIIGFALAVAACYVAGTAFISHGNIQAVARMGMDVTLSNRIDAALHDMTHMYAVYLPLVVVGLLIAFVVAAGIIRYLLPDMRFAGYVSAGFVAMIALHVIMKAVVGVSGIAATREISGLLLQGAAGAIGGCIYHLVTSPAAERKAVTTNATTA